MLVTALITPFHGTAAALDLEAVERLVAFQLEQGCHQVLLFGTTGEGASLTEAERERMLAAAREAAPPGRLMVSIGPGRLDELIARGRAALQHGVRDLLLVDAPYAGPSSASLRTAWHGAVAAALPEARLFPYAVPSRTSTELLPDDLARLAQDHPNVVGVKDATGRLARMLRVRELCGPDFLLLCGDDALLADAVLHPEIRAQGGCSVASNLAPAALVALLEVARQGQAGRGRWLHERLAPLFELVSVRTVERLQVGGAWMDVPQKTRNPAPIKAAMAQLGLLGGPCRPPHGPLSARAADVVAGQVADARRRDPQVLDAALARLARAPAGELVSGAT